MKLMAVVFVIVVLGLSGCMTSFNVMAMSRAEAEDWCDNSVPEIFGRCFDGEWTISDVFKLGLENKVNIRFAVHAGEMCTLSRQAFSEGWTREIYIKYSVDQCRSAFKLNVPNWLKKLTP